MKKANFVLLQKHISSFLSLKDYNKKIILVRSAESSANISGTIAGWTDVKLTDLGRKQAYTLYRTFKDFKYTQVFCSDLQRSRDTAYYAMGFPGDADESFIQQKEQIRELYFGEEEGIHFDGMSEAEKRRFNSPDYKAKGGESWKGVKRRALKFMNGLDDGNHLLFTHGGLMCGLLYDHGVKTIPTNCSIYGIGMKNTKESEYEDLDRIVFEWEYPILEDEI